jgi:hypothetical protein
MTRKRDWRAVNISLGSNADAALRELTDRWGMPASQVISGLLLAAHDAPPGYTLEAGPPPARQFRALTWTASGTGRATLPLTADLDLEVERARLDGTARARVLRHETERRQAELRGSKASTSPTVLAMRRVVLAEPEVPLCATLTVQQMPHYYALTLYVGIAATRVQPVEGEQVYRWLDGEPIPAQPTSRASTAQGEAP